MTNYDNAICINLYMICLRGYTRAILEILLRAGKLNHISIFRDLCGGVPVPYLCQLHR